MTAFSDMESTGRLAEQAFHAAAASDMRRFACIRSRRCLSFAAPRFSVFHQISRSVDQLLRCNNDPPH